MERVTESPRARTGEGSLVVRRVAGRSVTTRALASSPLRLLHPRNAGHASWTYVTSFGGGLVDGDALALDVEVGEGATALIGTQASTKVYRATRAGASQALAVRVADAGLALLVPDPVVCFRGARYAQRVDVDLAPGGSLVLLDALHAGRVARGERWAFDRCTSRIDVRVGGRLVLSERTLLDPRHGPLGERLGAYDALVTLVLVGERVAAHAEALRARVAASHRAGPRPTRLEAASALRGGGVLVRLAAATAADALACTRDYLGFVAELLGDDPAARRW